MAALSLPIWLPTMLLLSLMQLPHPTSAHPWALMIEDEAKRAGIIPEEGGDRGIGLQQEQRDPFQQ